MCIGTDESFFVLRYLPDRVAAALESKEEATEDGIEGAFEVGGSGSRRRSGTRVNILTPSPVTICVSLVLFPPTRCWGRSPRW